MFYSSWLLICISFFLLTGCIHYSNAVPGEELAIPRSAFAYQASLRYNNKHVCGGSIISKNQILTSASCLIGRNYSASWLVVVGDLNLANPISLTVTNRVQNILVHENYNPVKPNDGFDIAILTIVDSFNWAKTVQSISLRANTSDSVRQCNISGWGITGDFEPNQRIDLTYVTVSTTSIQSCNNSHFQAQNEWLPNDITCAGTEEQSCLSDLGGPLVCSDELVGIKSSVLSTKKCLSTTYGVYTDVGTHSDWILTHLNNGSIATSASLGLVFSLIFILNQLFG